MARKYLFEHLYLHVGTHKTGTSAIQAHLHNNSNIISKQNLLYPKTGVWSDKSHHKWAFALWDEENGKSKLEALFEELSAEVEQGKFDIDNAVISSEMIEKLPVKQQNMERLSYFLERIARSITIVIFFRRQDLLVESVFKQWVKDPSVRLDTSRERFLARQGENLNYLKIAQLWENQKNVKDVIVRIYNKSVDPISEILDVIAPNIDKGKLKKSKKLVNLSLDGKALEFKYLTNKAGLSLEEDRTLLKLVNKHLDNSEFLTLFKDGQRDKFLKTFIESNEKLKKRYNLPAFSSKIPQYSRTITPLSGQDILKFSQKISKDNEKIIWKVFHQLAYRGDPSDDDSLDSKLL